MAASWEIRTVVVAQVRHRCQYVACNSVNCLATTEGELLCCCGGGGRRRCSWSECGVHIDKLCQLRFIASSKIPAKPGDKAVVSAVKQVTHSEIISNDRIRSGKRHALKLLNKGTIECQGPHLRKQLSDSVTKCSVFNRYGNRVLNSN